MKNYTNKDCDLLSRTISAMRFPLAVLVVYIHSKMADTYDVPNWHDFQVSDLFLTLQILISSVIGHLSVSAFYVISGFLFFYGLAKFDTDTYKSKLRKRFRTLIVPYVLWNALIIIYIVCLKIAAFFVKGKPLSNITDWLVDNGGIRMFWDCSQLDKYEYNWIGQFTSSTGPILVPLWFLRDLIVVVLITPIIYVLLRRFKMKWLLVLALCYITGIFPYVHGFSITAVFFFSFGAYFSISHRNMVEELRRFRLVSYILVIPLIAIMVYYNSKYSAVGMYIYPFYIIIGVIALFNFTAQLIEKGKNIELPTLTKATFFVYAVHGFIGLGVAAMILDRVIPMSTTYWPYMTLRYMLMPLLAIIICLIINALMKRFCPKILRVLTGSR